MRNYLAVAVLLLLCLVLLSGSAFARDWFVATNGNDSTGDGTINNPYATPQVAFNNTQPGDTVQIRAGTYSGGVTVWGGAYKSGAPGAYITVRAYDGALTAHVGRLALQPVSYLIFDGLDVSTSDVQCVNVCGLEIAAPNYNRSHHVQFLNCRFNMTDTDGVAGGGDEIFKSSQADYILVQDCELQVLAGGNFVPKTSLAMDWLWLTYSTARRVYIHDFNKFGIYWKGGGEYNVLEDSVIANGRTGWCPTQGVSVGGDGSGREFANNNTDYGQEYMVSRNNIIRGLSKAGFYVTSSNWAYIYNNLIADVANIVPVCGPGATWGYITCMTFPADGSQGNGTGSNHTRAYNNIFLDTAGIMTMAYHNQLGGTQDFLTGNNCYYNAGYAIPAGDLGIDPATEAGHVFANPNLTLSGTPTTWQGWVDYYRPTSNSTAIRDAGNSNAGACPRPGVIADIEGNGRPRGGGWDIGPYEWPGSYNQPVADFTGGPTSGSPPMGVDFQDLTTSAPTSWSWTFGDGGTSTVQNPSHIYTAFGSYTVALTATNPAGSDSVSKTGYIAVHVTGFTSNVTWGAVPLTVNFTDQTLGSPTSWSWTFGDGGTSTAQNPSHTYTTAGYYDVSLTTNGPVGQDSITKSGYITACNEVIVYPTSWTSDWLTPNGTQHVVSGSLSNLQAVDGSCMDVACNTQQVPGCTAPSGVYSYSMYYYCASGYTAAQVYGMKVDYTARSTVSGSPYCHRFFLNQWEATDCPIRPFPTSWTTVTATRVGSMGGYLDSGGNLWVHICGQQASAAYDIQADCLRWHLYLMPGGGGSPPVANFSGTPTSGVLPLAVNFTDSSTNSPTSWSWNFGDGSTSTAQNPSHTYTTAGTYTVALTATNAGGNNTCTKSNYITVTNIVYLDASSYGQGGSVYISGALSDTYTENSQYLVLGSDANHCYRSYFFFTPGYTAAQISSMEVETKFHTSRSDTPHFTFYMYKPPPINAWTVMYAGLWNTTDTWMNYSTTSISDYIDSNGQIQIMLCGCPTSGNSNDYQVSWDVVNLKLALAGGGNAPVANFSGSPTSGTAPLGVTFTDSSTNTPTAWSWTFGDSSTSTAQNPSHTYSSAGTYTVALTATNSYGNNTCTKSNYITATVPAPVADFSGTPTSGLKPVTVYFTDSSTNSPTSWSWTFGDSSTSTAQNPSHTYTSAGTYTVALTATNAGGNNTCTKSNYITVTNIVYLDASSYSPGGSVYISGALSDTYTENGQYLVLGSDTGHCYRSYFTFTPGYTAGQISSMEVEAKFHNSRSDTPHFTFFMYKPPPINAWTVMYSGLWTTSDAWMNYSTTSISDYIDSSGQILLMLCGCPTSGNSNDYQVSWDVVNLKLTLN